MMALAYIGPGGPPPTAPEWLGPLLLANYLACLLCVLLCVLTIATRDGEDSEAARRVRKQHARHCAGTALGLFAWPLVLYWAAELVDALCAGHEFADGAFLLLSTSALLCAALLLLGLGIPALLVARCLGDLPRALFCSDWSPPTGRIAPIPGRAL